MKILYVLGRGRGGSTILSNVLGELDGFFSAGEVRCLWDPLMATGADCACGQSLTQCPIWSRVVAEIDGETAASWHREVVRELKLATLLRRSPGSDSNWWALEAYTKTMRDLYTRLASITGARVIVDTSKRPTYGAFLRLVPGLSVLYVHLLRDPRASAYSWKRRRYESARAGEYVKQHGAFNSTLRWDVLNLEAEALAKAVGHASYLRLRFEDFVSTPSKAVERIASFVGEPRARLPFVDTRFVELGANHSLAGNPSRYMRGKVEIRDSQEWRDQSRLDLYLSSITAAPLLHRYGYPFVLSSRAREIEQNRPRDPEGADPSSGRRRH